MEYFVQCWSGGKDSTASIILAHENGEPINEILFVEVMYDLKRDISGENPEHINFIKNIAKPLFESWGYKVTIIRSEKDYLSCFNRKIERPTKYMDHKGKKFGFPAVGGCCYVKRDLKLKPMEKYLKNIKGELIQYVGIAKNEPGRLKALKQGRISLLDKYEYTEEAAMDLCKKYNLLSPGYEFSKRGGCWFCPNAKLEEHRQINKIMPNIWQEFITLEKEDVAYGKWNSYTKETLKQRDEKIKWEDAQISLFDLGIIKYKEEE